MPHYRRSPIEVAAEWFAPSDGDQHRCLDLRPSEMHGDLAVRTIEGNMHFSEGDWIVTDVQGEYSPCTSNVGDKFHVESEVNRASTDWPEFRVRAGDRPVRATRSMMRSNVHEVEGDLLDQDVDVIVNAWNRNMIPWWLLFPQGVSGAIKRRAGTEPFRELGKFGRIPLGGAVMTGAGCLPQRAIIHVAGINLLWRASDVSIRASVANALQLAVERGYRSIALPLIGAGSGGFATNKAKRLILDQIRIERAPIEVIVVTYRKRSER